MSETTVPYANAPRAGFFRRLAAIVYDALVAIAVGMCAALVMIITLLVLFETGVLNKNGVEQVSDIIQQSLFYTTVIQLWVGFWVCGFFLWFWKHGGQTIGMRAWRLRLFSMTEQPVGYGRLLLRMVTSFLGLGTLLVLIDVKHKLALQDRASQIEVLSLSQQENDHKSWR
ncbi:RDD family protein [Alteromonas oceanisediminis]|uniref:RDD family protein n=1 Tax=Alteromonas oceanisediminis TaxID=2836180 RepID=UPI001BD95744|nr:RDD family protein [Alteromonas oceanisediminis]MBT0585416.1 RDD family protein [Alteromonas oceanisediminis]